LLSRLLTRQCIRHTQTISLQCSCASWPEATEADTIEQLIAKATEIHTDNKARIADISTRPPLKLRSYWLNPVEKHAGYTVPVVESVCHRPAAEIVAEWHPSGGFAAIDDVFNDDLQFDITTFGMAVTMNEKMVKTMSKYRLFGEGSLEGKRVLVKFVDNYRRINTELQNLQHVLSGVPSQLDTIAAKFHALEQEFNKTLASSSVCIGIPPPQELLDIGLTSEHLDTLRSWIKSTRGVDAGPSHCGIEFPLRT
jgi:hypothetical protein